MTFDYIQLTTDDRGIATLTLDRADKHNALNADMCDEIKTAAQMINGDSEIRAVIFAADGKSFCAGGDLSWMRQQFDATREVRIAEAKRLANMLFALNTLKKPLIGKVQGNAFGGGIGMMSVCDVVVSVEGAKFGLTETKLGLIPATISPYVLARMEKTKRDGSSCQRACSTRTKLWRLILWLSPVRLKSWTQQLKLKFCLICKQHLAQLRAQAIGKGAWSQD